MVWAAASRGRSAQVPAVDRAVRLLFALGDGHEDASLTDLARLLRLHKSTAHNILATLVRHRFVDRDPATRTYRLGPALAALGRAVAGRQDLVALARPHLGRLRQLSGETATLHLRDGAGSVILASEESSHQLKVTAPPGHRLPPFAGAVAKVLLAWGDPGAGQLPARLPAYTPRTITAAGEYLEELRGARRAGVAYDEMEYLPGVRAVSAPVFQGLEDQGHAIGALSIVGVAARISPQDLRRLAGPLRNAARTLSAALHPALDSGETARASSARRRTTGRKPA